jgi:hypothetical protein
MADNTQDGLSDLLAEICVILKQHEEILFDLKVEAECLSQKALTGHDRAEIESARDRVRGENAQPHEHRLRSIDGIIARLRGT